MEGYGPSRPWAFSVKKQAATTERGPSGSTPRSNCFLPRERLHLGLAMLGKLPLAASGDN